jgi:hypothetical protein
MAGDGRYKRPIVFYVLGGGGKKSRDPKDMEPMGPLAEPLDHPDQEPGNKPTYSDKQGKKKKKTRGFFLNRYIY